MKTCFDANILLETLLKGRRNAHIATKYLSRTQDGAITPLTAHLYVYFGKKDGNTTLDLLEDLKAYRITVIDESVVRLASNLMKGDDFEDALQIASALQDGCDTFVTFDSKLAKNYSYLSTLKVKLLV